MSRFEDGPVSTTRGMLAQVYSNWGLLELDFQQTYGIDLGEPGLLQRRTWRWMTLRALGLLSVESRVQRVLNPTPEQQKAAARSSA